MKKLFTLSAIVALFFSLNGLLFAGNAHGVWVDNFKQAKQQSIKTGKPILANFTGSDWCGWCIRLDKEVFSKKAFKEYAAKNLVLFVADFPSRNPQSKTLKKQNSDLAKKYSIQGYPTILLLNAEGKVLLKTGYKQGGPENYIKGLNSEVKQYITKHGKQK